MNYGTKITINGRQYDRVEDLPPEARKQYDLALAAFSRKQGTSSAPSSLEVVGPVKKSIVQESFVYEGQTYHSRADLPAEVREALDQFPQPDADAGSDEMVINTIRELPPQVHVIRDETEVEQPSPARSPWLLVLLLTVIVVVLLFLWLSGIRPGRLWGR